MGSQVKGLHHVVPMASVRHHGRRDGVVARQVHFCGGRDGPWLLEDHHQLGGAVVHGERQLAVPGCRQDRRGQPAHHLRLVVAKPSAGHDQRGVHRERVRGAGGGDGPEGVRLLCGRYEAPAEPVPPRGGGEGGRVHGVLRGVRLVLRPGPGRRRAPGDEHRRGGAGAGHQPDLGLRGVVGQVVAHERQPRGGLGFQGEVVVGIQPRGLSGVRVDPRDGQVGLAAVGDRHVLARGPPLGCGDGPDRRVVGPRADGPGTQHLLLRLLHGAVRAEAQHEGARGEPVQLHRPPPRVRPRHGGGVAVRPRQHEGRAVRILARAGGRDHLQPPVLGLRPRREGRAGDHHIHRGIRGGQRDVRRRPGIGRQVRARGSHRQRPARQFHPVARLHARARAVADLKHLLGPGRQDLHS
mmetsp:Transcript_38254/g.85807  ORF Transcript_38254/g.85807 Transcript_38254/m.85807 type:complete len:409 (-) Transcript_38254:1537-2763(-)